ncbi:MAG: DUF2842 domain-containing protein [Pikeienuella sp.]
MTYKARKFWAAVVLLVGLPVYIVLAITVVGLFERPPLWLELVIYIGLGMAWILPFKGLFRGIGKPDPDAPPEDDASG